MPLAGVSRWTLSFFGCALLALVLALGLLVAGIGYPADGLMAPGTLIVVHLLAVGWLTLLMFGALLQFLPVLVGRDLVWAGLAPVALVLIVAGLGLMVCGFAALDGFGVPAELLPLGGLLVLGGFCVVGAVLIATLLRAETLPLPACFVAVALMSVLVTALLGESLASAMTGVFGGDFAVALVSHGVPLHAGFGLGGWLTFAAMGVSYRLLSMFLVAPERGGALPKIAFWSGVVGLAALCVACGVLVAVNTPLPLAGTLALLAALGSVAAYLGDVATLYRTRRRKGIELHMGAAAGAFAMLGLGAAVLAAASATGGEAAVAAGVYLLVLGWLSGLCLAMLYKIVPFLTWLECFAPTMGRAPTPRVQDIVCERRAQGWFVVYFGGVGLGALALLAKQPLWFQAGSMLQLAAVILLMHQFIRARRLLDLPVPWRDHPKPRLLLPAQRQRTAS